MRVDAHAHLLPDEEGVKRLLAYMDAAALDRMVVVPGGMIDPKGMASFLRGTQPLLRDDAPNDFVLETCRQLSERFIPFVQVNPTVHDPDFVLASLLRGAAGLKLNPIVDRVAFDDPELTPILALANERRLPLYTHILLNRAASLANLEARVKEFPRVPFIIGHMGYATSDPEATRMAVKYDNVFLETSIGAFLAIEDAVARAGPGKIIYGSEAPAHHPAAEWAKLENLGLSASALDAIGGGTMLGLIADADTRVS